MSLSLSRFLSVRRNPFDKYFSVEPYSFLILWKARSMSPVGRKEDRNAFLGVCGEMFHDIS